MSYTVIIYIVNLIINTNNCFLFIFRTNQQKYSNNQTKYSNKESLNFPHYSGGSNQYRGGNNRYTPQNQVKSPQQYNQQRTPRDRLVLLYEFNHFHKQVKKQSF